MVASTRKPRTGTEICVGQNMPAFTAHLVHKYGGADAVGFSKTSLAAEIDANNLRVRIEELSMAVEMAEKHCDDDTARSLADRQKKLSLQLDALIKGEQTADAIAPPQDSQTFFNVRIRWMKWTGKAPEMQDLIKTHTDKDGSIQHVNDAIHSGGVGGCGAVFPKITIQDFATFCRKAEEYGYAVELVEAPVAEEANLFVVRAPV